MYYLSNQEDILCGIYLKSLCRGTCYCVQYYYFIGKYTDPIDYPTKYDFDLSGCIALMSKEIYQGQSFETDGIDYMLYTTDELLPYFEKAFREYIMPPIIYGKKCLYEQTKQTRSKYEVLYYPPIDSKKEEVVRKLQD